MSAPSLRFEPEPQDVARVGEVVRSTGFFSPEEIRIAEELVEARLRHGEASGYHFVFQERAGVLLGYTAFGPIPATRSSWDLYWIAVGREHRGQRLGRALLDVTEAQIRQLGGSRVYADTSGRSQYAPTHRFYERCGYTLAATLEDYYAPGDAKRTYLKVLGAGPREES